MNRDIFNRFLNGTSTKEETKKVFEWLQAPYSDNQLREWIEKDIEESLRKQIKERKVLDHLLPGIFASDVQSNVTDDRSGNHTVQRHLTFETRKKNPRKYIKWAASIVFIVSLSFLLYSIQRESVNTNKAEVTVQMITKTNGYGRKSTIFLKDGTAVYLDSDSKITYPSSFTGNKREITLTGEAYFDVASDPSKPFIVKAGPVSIKVLGTRFNVKAFAGAKEIKVSLEKGQVEVTNEVNNKGISDKLFLSPGQSVIYHLQREDFGKVIKFDPLEDCGWKDGIIYFKKASFKNVIAKLEKWYNVQFKVVNQPPAVWSYSGKFDNQNLDNVLRSIGFSQEFSYDIMNDKVVIKFKVDSNVSHP
jgi:ferric-dicitrate binding protein FerR (iron transport regulator)